MRYIPINVNCFTTNARFELATPAAWRTFQPERWQNCVRCLEIWNLFWLISMWILSKKIPLGVNDRMGMLIGNRLLSCIETANVQWRWRRAEGVCKWTSNEYANHHNHPARPLYGQPLLLCSDHIQFRINRCFHTLVRPNKHFSLYWILVVVFFSLQTN